MKVQLENDLKTLEETRRRLHALQMEGVSLGESETKMKNSLTSLRKGVNIYIHIYTLHTYSTLISFTSDKTKHITCSNL